MGTQTMPIDSEFKVDVLIMPAGQKVELELPAAATVKIIIDSLINDPSLGIERINPTTQKPYNFTLASKGMGKELANHMTLHEAGVQNGDTLVLNPDLVAGYF